MKDEVKAAQSALNCIRTAIKAERSRLEAVKNNKRFSTPIIASIARLELEKLRATKTLLEAQEAAELRAVIRARQEWIEHLNELRETRERLKQFVAVG
jgi:uncharacterized protein (DUF3084 family)